MARYIDADMLLEELQEELDFESSFYTKEQNEWFNKGLKCALRDVKHQPTAGVVEVKHISEKIIRRQADVSSYWQNDVKSYRAMQGYSDIEHDVDNFLRGYNEAVEDILAILDGTKERGGDE